MQDPSIEAHLRRADGAGSSTRTVPDGHLRQQNIYGRCPEDQPLLHGQQRGRPSNDSAVLLNTRRLFHDEPRAVVEEAPPPPPQLLAGVAEAPPPPFNSVVKASMVKSYVSHPSSRPGKENIPYCTNRTKSYYKSKQASYNSNNNNNIGGHSMSENNVTNDDDAHDNYHLKDIASLDLAKRPALLPVDNTKTEGASSLPPNIVPARHKPSHTVYFPLGEVRRNRNNRAQQPAPAARGRLASEVHHNAVNTIAELRDTNTTLRDNDTRQQIAAHAKKPLSKTATESNKAISRMKSFIIKQSGNSKYYRLIPKFGDQSSKSNSSNTGCNTAVPPYASSRTISPKLLHSVANSASLDGSAHCHLLNKVLSVEENDASGKSSGEKQVLNQLCSAQREDALTKKHREDIYLDVWVKL